MPVWVIMRVGNAGQLDVGVFVWAQYALPQPDGTLYLYAARDDQEPLAGVVAGRWVSWEVVGEGRTAICQQCGAFFVQTDARQKFCPPPPGVKASRCGRRGRMADLRQRQKEVAPPAEQAVREQAYETCYKENAHA